MKENKKKLRVVEDLVHHTKGGEMPDPSRKVAEKASDAAKVFERMKVKPRSEPKKASR